MIKRISFLFCAVLMVVTMLAVPAFATEVQNESSINIVQQPEDYISTDGYFQFSVVAEGKDLSYLWFFSTDGGVSWSAIDNRTSELTSSGANVRDGCLYRCWIRSSDGTEAYTRSATLYYKFQPMDNSVTKSISSVLQWVGSVVDSLISPEGALYPLLPILAIGIAITGVLLVTKIFKSFSWGL